MTRSFARRLIFAGGLALLLLAGCATSAPESEAPAPIELRFKANGIVLWNGEEITFEQLRTRLRAGATRNPPIHISSDRDAGSGWLALFNAMVEEFDLTHVGVIGGT